MGVLGCGPIAQAAHFESANKARNVRLHAICDVAEDLLARMAATHAPDRTYARYEDMLADPDLDAVVIATADAFHVPAALMALEAGKHVLCEKPLAVAVEEAEALAEAVQASGLVLQVGHMKRFDAGIQSARDFVRGGMGAMIAYKGWYCDSTHRYANTDAVQPLILRSAQARRPDMDPKADKRRYFMLAHGCHLLDTARYLAGPIEAVRARLLERAGAWCWFVDAEFASGALGHLELTVPVRMDWHEGFTIHGEGGSVTARTYNPWFFRSSDVEVFHEATATTTRVLGADAHFYRRQMEAFADRVLSGLETGAADAADGVASVRGMAAVARSAGTGRTVRLDEVSGAV